MNFTRKCASRHIFLCLAYLIKVYNVKGSKKKGVIKLEMVIQLMRLARRLSIKNFIIETEEKC